MSGEGGGWVRGSQIQKSWEAVKRLDRFAPNLVHLCGFIWEWTSRLKTILPTIPHGGILGGFMGSTIKKTGKFGQSAGPIGNQFCSYNAVESGNGHRLYKLAP